MAIQLYDPVGEVEAVKQQPMRVLETLSGKRIGYIFNQHVSGLAFWKALEHAVDAKFNPSTAHRVYKANTWAPAPKAEMERVLKETDYVLVGVGA
jgi:hypothetical protein